MIVRHRNIVGRDYFAYREDLLSASHVHHFYQQTICRAVHSHNSPPPLLLPPSHRRCPAIDDDFLKLRSLSSPPNCFCPHRHVVSRHACCPPRSHPVEYLLPTAHVRPSSLCKCTQYCDDTLTTKRTPLDRTCSTTGSNKLQSTESSPVWSCAAAEIESAAPAPVVLGLQIKQSRSNNRKRELSHQHSQPALP